MSVEKPIVGQDLHRHDPTIALNFFRSFNAFDVRRSVFQLDGKVMSCFFGASDVTQLADQGALLR